MSHTQEILDTLALWKNKKFRASDILFSDAADSIASDSPLVIAMPWQDSKWAIFNKATKKGAVLVYTGIWRWNSNLETGNFVPEGYEAPQGTPESRICNEPSWKCEASHAFDTVIDASFWDNLKKMETHTTEQKGFNKANKKRRVYQNGVNPVSRDKYVVTSKIFVRRTPYNTKEGGEFKVPYELHPWIADAMAVTPTPYLIPNPSRPKYLDYNSENRALTQLQDSANPDFSREAWWPEVVPVEFIRLGKLPDTMVSKPSTNHYPSLDDDFEPLELGISVDLIDDTDNDSAIEESTRKRKRLAEELTDHIDKRQEMDVDIEPNIRLEEPPSLAGIKPIVIKLRPKGKENRPPRI